MMNRDLMSMGPYSEKILKILKILGFFRSAPKPGELTLCMGIVDVEGCNYFGKLN